jgi:hypothetical protein
MDTPPDRHPRRRARLAAACLGALAIGCGGTHGSPAAAGASEEHATGTTGGADAHASDPAPSGPTGSEPADAETYRPLADLPAIFGNPELSAYVLGPRPVALEDYADAEAGASRFRAGLRIVNEGETSARIAAAHVAFEVWGTDEEPVPCSPPIAERTRRPPPDLEPNEAHELSVVAVCPLPGPGEYEVRAYVSFEAAEPGGDFDVERHYAGRYELTVADPS